MKNKFGATPLRFLLNLIIIYIAYGVCRVAFVMENWGLFASDFQWSSVPEMMHGAWMFDTSAILYTNVLYALLMLIPLHHKETRGWQMTAKWVYIIINGVCIAANLADSVYFKYTMRRTTNTIFSEFSNEGNIGSIIGVEFLRHWYLVLLFIIIMWGIWKFYFMGNSKRSARTSSKPRGKQLVGYYVVQTVCFGLFIPLCICGMRGGATTAVRPITISNANQYIAHPQEAGIVLNTPFSLIRTIGKKAFEIPNYMTEEEMNALYSPVIIPNFSPSLNNSSSSLIPNSSSLIPNSSSDMFINFNINCTPEATIRLLMDSRTNDYITMQGNGMLRATYYNKGAFNLFGTYTLAHGTYGITIQNIIKKNFTFREGGTFVFGGNPYDATLNLQAIHTVNGVSLADLNVGNSFTNNTIKVNCLMNIGGIARNPQVSFDLDMPTVSSDEKQMIRSVLNSEDELNQQVVYLLGIGRFYPTGTNNSASREQSETSLAMQSLLSGTISSQISSVLNTVIKNDNWNFGANISTGDEGWNNAEYEGTVNGRLLNNRLLINGQFGYRDNVNTANTNFIGDFDIRYLLMPNGNLALKVYNQTNDRYFTKSSLNTQGVGIIMKKDFRSIIDLFGKKKKKDKK